jgi:hypothetical protein
VADLLVQEVIGVSGNMRAEWVLPPHFVAKPNRLPLALRLVVDYMRLNVCLVCNKAAVFPVKELCTVTEKYSCDVLTHCMWNISLLLMPAYIKWFGKLILTYAGRRYRRNGDHGGYDNLFFYLWNVNSWAYFLQYLKKHINLTRVSD